MVQTLHDGRGWNELRDPGKHECGRDELDRARHDAKHEWNLALFGCDREQFHFPRLSRAAVALDFVITLLRAPVVISHPVDRRIRLPGPQMLVRPLCRERTALAF